VKPPPDGDADGTFGPNAQGAPEGFIMAMTLDLSRWQFGITTVFHFMFVPLTIGLALLLAIMQTAAHRTRKDAERHDKWDHMTRFWRRLFLINFAVGVVTGIVQEFQFGMNWSVYSRYVGSVFGAPLAVEALLAFFLESTFLGIWIFGKGRVSARVHLASIWLVSIGTMLSALFILAANAWMQHPVGYKVVGNRAVMTNFWAVMTNSTLIGSFLHVLFSALVTSTMLILGVSAWHLLKDRRAGHAPQQVFATSAKLALVVGAVAIVATMFFGDNQARIMERQQPMKMAAAEAIYNTQNGASFSLLTIGDLSGNPIFQIRLPHMLSVLADNNWDGPVQGINQIQAKEVAKYGPGNYRPILWVTYWTFRIMVGCGILMLLLLAAGLWLMRRRRLEQSAWFLRFSVFAIALPFVANTTGWIFTEMGRQPWVVYGLLKTSQAVSHIGTGYVVTSLVGFTAIYSLLAAIDFGLMARFARGEGETDDHDDEPEPEPGDNRVPALVY
jgi:cytochrome d ubiquinol oxidase subunit I